MILIAPLERYRVIPKQSLFPYYHWGLGFDAPSDLGIDCEIWVLGIDNQTFASPEPIRFFLKRHAIKWHKNGGYKPGLEWAYARLKKDKDAYKWREKLEKVYFSVTSYSAVRYRVRFRNFDPVRYYRNREIKLEAIEEHLWVRD